MPLLFALSLMTSPLLAADGLQPHTQVAIGLSPLDRGLSLWLVRPKTWVGIEFDRLEWYWDEVPSYRDDPFLSFNVRGSLTAQRIFTPGPVFQLGYLSVYHVSYQSEGKIGDPGGLERRNGGGDGAEIGWGLIVQPWKRVSVALRQGVAYQFYQDRYSYYGDEYPNPTNQQASDIHSLRLQRARLWVLVHF